MGSRPETVYSERSHNEGSGIHVPNSSDHGTYDQNIPSMALASAERWGDKVAVVDDEVTLSFTEISQTMLVVAKALLARGVEPGDRIAIWSPNSAAYIPLVLGIQAVGGWLVPLNTRFKGDEAAYILDKTDAKMIFLVPGFLGVDYEQALRLADPELDVLSSVISMPGPGTMTTDSWDSFLAEGSAMSDGPVLERISALGPDDVSDIIFTSGTTGLPKGVMLRHGASLRGFGTLNSMYTLDEESHHLVVTPFFHCFGYKSGWMQSLMYGAVTYPVAIFDGAKALKMIDEHGITHMPGSPTMFSAILDHPDRAKYDLDTLDCTLISASTIPEQLVRRVRDEIGASRTLTGYGLTENHGLVSVTRPTDAPDVVATTAGRFFDDIEVRVVDDEGIDVPSGEPGELWIRGYLQMSGYFDEPEATAATIVDGWLHTGDVVVVHEDRYLSVTDRLKDIYIMGGFNVAPAEVERKLLDIGGVAQVAIVGVPDDHFGEVGAAFIMRNPGSDLSEQEVISYAKDHLANYKVPRSVEFVAEFPLNATGKVLKHVLRRATTAGGSGR